MSNVMLGFPNRADASTMSSGSWAAALPITNLQSRLIGKVARTTDATLASTKFDINLGAPKNIRILSLVNHNISLAGKYRIRGSSVSNFATVLVDTGWVDVWPVVYPYGTLQWEDPNWWGGKYSDEQISGYTPALIVILSANILARYWRIEIDDTANSFGYVQAGRLFLGPAWQPTANTSYGATSIAWETKTVVDEAISGAEYFDRRTPYRVERVSFDWMSEDEAFTNAFEITRRAGLDQEIMFIHDPADTSHALRRRFLSRMRTLNPIEFPYVGINKEAFEFKELI